jgi:hypothetical protein
LKVCERVKKNLAMFHVFSLFTTRAFLPGDRDSSSGSGERAGEEREGNQERGNREVSGGRGREGPLSKKKKKKKF